MALKQQVIITIFSSLFLSLGAGAQDATIKGIVTDTISGAPIAGATVQVGDQDKASQSVGGGGLIGSALTQADGSYAIQISMADVNSRTIVVEAAGPEHTPHRYGGSPNPALCFFNCAGGSGGIEITPGETRDNTDFALEPGKRFSGQVSHQATGDPLNHARIEVVDESGLKLDFQRTSTDLLGVYKLPYALPPGDYFVRASFGTLIDQAWQGFDCEFGACPILDATPVTIDDGAAAEDIDFELRDGSRIRGDIAPQEANIIVSLYNAAGAQLDSTVPDGTLFIFNGLVGGSYYLVFTPTAADTLYVPEVHNGQHCPIVGCDPTRGEPIRIFPGGQVLEIVREVQQGGSVSGQIVDSQGQRPPLTGSTFHYVEIIDTEGRIVGGGPIEAFDTRLDFSSANGIPSGEYFVRTYSSVQGRGIGYFQPGTGLDGIVPGHADAISDGPGDPSNPQSGGRTCAGQECDLSDLSPVRILENQTSKLNIEITPGSHVFGTVSDASEDKPIAGALVKLIDAQGNLLATTRTDTNGNYTFGAFPAGEYYLRTSMSGQPGTSVSLSATPIQHPYFDHLFGSDQSCSEALCNPTDGQAIQLDGENDAGPFDLNVSFGPVILGRMIDVLNGLAIGAGYVEVSDSDGSFVGRYHIDPMTGQYRTTALKPGDYLVRPVISPAFKILGPTPVEIFNDKSQQKQANRALGSALTQDRSRTAGDNFPVTISPTLFSSTALDINIVDKNRDVIFSSNFLVED